MKNEALKWLAYQLAWEKKLVLLRKEVKALNGPPLTTTSPNADE